MTASAENISTSQSVVRNRLANNLGDSDRTRERIIQLLKTEGPCTATELSDKLSMTAMGVRRHLSQLEVESLVEHKVEQQQRGRPTHRYFLTSAGDELFPRHYDRLARSLVELIAEIEGPEKLQQLLKQYLERQKVAYKKTLGELPLHARVLQLARLRDEEGYMGSSERLEDGSLLLVENNCALCEVARSCSLVCESEMQMFRELLPEATVERIQHIANGDQFCTYRIEPRVQDESSD